MTVTNKITYWLIFANDQVLLKKISSQYQILTTLTKHQIESNLLCQHTLINTEHGDIHCAELNNPAILFPDTELLPLRRALEILGKEWYHYLTKSYAIINWDKNHRYCGRCGQLTYHQQPSFERVCHDCALTFYPHISPSIIVLIKKKDQILLARSHHFKPNVYGLIAGFIEPGETVEEAVHREVQEETGIKIKNLHYVDSQFWPFPDSLVIAFTADYASGTLQIDPKELEMADWYHYDELPGYPSSSISIAKRLIDEFVKEKKTNKS